MKLLSRLVNKKCQPSSNDRCYYQSREPNRPSENRHYMDMRYFVELGAGLMKLGDLRTILHRYCRSHTLLHRILHIVKITSTHKALMFDGLKTVFL